MKMAKQTKYTVVLVEDHIIVRNGLKELIEHMGDYQVTGEYDNGKQLVSNLARLDADIIIMDLTMPVMDGPATMRWLKENSTDLPVLILTLDTSDKTIIELYKLGVRGYLPKTCTADVLKTAIDDIIRTGYYHNELLANAIRKEDAQGKHGQHTDITSKFGAREMEFLLLVCDKNELTQTDHRWIQGVIV